MKPVFLIAVLIAFASGAIWGGGGISFSDTLNLKSMFELGSYIATILVAGVGVKTMNAWQAQFKHSEKYKAIKEFQSSLDGSALADAYINIMFQKCYESNHHGSPLNVVDVLGLIQEKQKAWFGKCSQVDRCWESLIFLLSDAELKAFDSAPKDIEVRVQKLVQYMFEVVFSGGAVNFSELYRVVSECSTCVRNENAELYHASNVILKKLVG